MKTLEQHLQEQFKKAKLGFGYKQMIKAVREWLQEHREYYELRVALKGSVFIDELLEELEG